MLDKFLDTTKDLIKKNEPFAMATIVWREAPSSGKTGDKAIINKYGDISGWAGGGCVKAIMIKESEDAMRTGKARLVRIGQSATTIKQPGVMEYKMTCQSEGAVEIFIEPVMPPPHLIVMGQSAIARALTKLGKFAGYKVTAVAPDAKPTTFEGIDELITQMNLERVKLNPVSFIVVATQGEQDEEALMQALQENAGYVGFVASKKKRDTVLEYLHQSGIEAGKTSIIHSPAGIDINAKKPEEVAISIFAEIVQVLNNAAAPLGFAQFDTKGEETPPTKYYINPVCGVPIDINNPKHIIEYEGEKIYFCCDGCKIKFEAEPDRYMKKIKA